MDTALIFAQTVFYFTVSVAIIVIGILCGILTYHLIRIARELEEISHKLNNAAHDAGERIQDVIERLSNVPILSYFLKKRSVSHTSPLSQKVRKGQKDNVKKYESR